MKQRLDIALAERGLVASRSQAESYVRLKQVSVNGAIAHKAGQMIDATDVLEVTVGQQYVSRAALKLASVIDIFKVTFAGKTVLDVGSSTGGFTQYALLHGATQVVAVEVGSDQLHPSLRSDPRIQLHEKTDIRDFRTTITIDMVVADVSFISLREILPAVARLCSPRTQLLIMVKPQFEAAASSLKHKGVIKNDRIRRSILQDFETWARQGFVIIDKADSRVSGSKGNIERFYYLKPL